MEVLQIRKFWLKKDQLDFMDGWMMQVNQMVENDPDNSDDLLQKLFENSIQNHLDAIIKSIDSEQ